jgi:hypothetical protein
MDGHLTGDDSPDDGAHEERRDQRGGGEHRAGELLHSQPRSGVPEGKPDSA